MGILDSKLTNNTKSKSLLDSKLETISPDLIKNISPGIILAGQTGVGESQYDTNITEGDLQFLNDIRANRQEHWDSFGNMLVRGAGKALLTIPESAGYLLDLPEVIGAQREFDNVLSEWARGQKESLDESLPEYSRYTEEGGEFNPLDMEFYMRGGDSVIESLGYLVPGFGIGGATARGLSLLGKLSPNIIRGTSALTAAVGTNYIESMQVAGQTYRDLIDKGVNEEGAAEAAKNIIWQGKANIAFELPQYLTLFRGFNTSQAFKNAGNSFAKFKAQDYAFQGLTEGAEEWSLDFISKENQRNAIIDDIRLRLQTATGEEKTTLETQLAQLEQEDDKSLINRFVDYASSDEGLTAGFLGALGGLSTQMGGDVINAGLAKFKKQPSEYDQFNTAVSQVKANTDLTKEVLKANSEIFKAQQEAIKSNDPTAYNLLQREALKNLAFANAEKGTYSQFLDTLDTLSTMNQDEAAQLGLNTQEVMELAQVFKKDAKVYENLYNQATQLSPDKTIQTNGFNILANKYLADNTVALAQNQINKIYSENASNVFGPTKQRVNRLVNQKEVYTKLLATSKTEDGQKFLQRKLSNVNQQIQQEIENLNSYIDSEFSIEEYSKIRGKKLNEEDFKNPLVDNSIQQQEKNLVVNQFESLKAQEEYKELTNPKVQEKLIKEKAAQEQELAEKAQEDAVKAIQNEFNTLIDSVNPDIKRLEDLVTQLKSNPKAHKDAVGKLSVLKDKLKKEATKPETVETKVEPTEVKTEGVKTTLSPEDFGFTKPDNTVVATSDSSDSEAASKGIDKTLKERKKKESLTGAYLDVEYITSPDGTQIASIRDENGNVVNTEIPLEDFRDYSKYPSGTVITFIIDRKWQADNNIPDSNWWELPIAAQIDGKTVFYINKFNAEPTDAIDSNIEQKVAKEYQQSVQNQLIAQRKDIVPKLLNNEVVTGKITEKGTGSIDGYTTDNGSVLDRLGNGKEVFKDVQFAVIDRKKSEFAFLTPIGDTFFVNNSEVTSTYKDLPNGSVVALLPSFHTENNKNELVARPIDRIQLSDEDIEIVLHLINTYGKYSTDEAKKTLGLTIPEGVTDVTEYLINNYVYNGKHSGSFFVTKIKNDRFIKVQDPSKKDKDGNFVVRDTINIKDTETVKQFLKTKRYNIHSKPYFELVFDGEKIAKANPLDSRTVIAQRTVTKIDNKTFGVIDSAENKMQILRQPAIFYSIDKPIESKKAPATKVKPQRVKETPKVSTTADIIKEISKLKSDPDVNSFLKKHISIEEFTKFNKDFKASGETSKSKFAKEYFITETKVDNKPENNPGTDSLKANITQLDNEKLRQLNKIEKSSNPYVALFDLIVNSPDKELRNLMFKLGSLNPKIEFITEVSNELAKVVYADNKIVINKYAVARNPRTLEYVVAHELLHLATLKGLTTDSAFNKNITKLYNQAKKQLGDSYALSNVREFVSEAFTNPEFKSQLKGLDYEGTNVFEKFWQWIKSLFGLRDNVFNLIDKYTNQYITDFVTDLEGNIVEDKLISDYEVEGMSLHESYDMVNSMTGLAQDIYRETSVNLSLAELNRRVYDKLQNKYNEVKDTGELDADVMLQYEAILFNNGDNDTFKKLITRVDRNIKYLSDLLSKEFDEEADTDLEEDEATQGSESYGREAFQDNPKDKASTRLKRFLAFIPDSRLTVDKTSYYTLENKYGLPQYVPYDVMYNTLAMELANRPQEDMLAALTALSRKDANKRVVLEKLNELRLSDNTDDKALYEEFFVNFNKQHASFVSVLFQNRDEGNFNRVIFSNRNNAEDTMIAKWLAEFKQTYTQDNGIVQIVDGQYSVNTAKAKELYAKFGKADSIKNINQKLFAYAEVLKEVGITIDEDAIELLLEEPKLLFKIKDTETAVTKFRQSVSFILTRLSENKAGETFETSLNNPFNKTSLPTDTKEKAGEGRNLEFLAQMQLKVDTNLLSSMFRNEEGKNIYSIFNNTLMSEIFTSLKNEKAREILFENWRNSAYHKDNWVIKQLLEGEISADDLELVLMSTMAQDGKSNSGKPYKNLTAQERQVAKLIAFTNSGVKGLIQFPTQSDKPSTPFCKLPKINVSIKDGKLEDIEPIYSIFLQEANRMIKANQDVKSFKGEPNENWLSPNYHYKPKKDKEGNLVYDEKGNTIPDYDKGNYRTFMMLPDLNNFKFTLNGAEYTLNEFILKYGITSEIKPIVEAKLNEIALAYIKNTKDFYFSLGITDANGKILPKFFSAKQEQDVIAEYTINYMVNYAAILSIFNNDPAYAKDIDDISKRGAMNLAPGLDLYNTTNEQFKSVVIKDVVFKSKNYQNMLDFFEKHFGNKARAEEFLSPYKDINGTDAQAYVSLDFFENIMQRLGRLDEKMKSVIDKARAGELDDKDIEVMQPLKLVYTQDVWDNVTGNYIRKYIKFSAFPLYSQLTQDKELDNFRKDIEAKGIDFVAFESASKLGTQGLQNIYNESGQLEELKEANIVQLPLKGMRLQQEIPYDADKAEINVVSQARKMLFGDLLDPVFQNVIDARELKTKFDKLHEANVLEKFESLKKELGLVLKDGRYTITNLVALKDLLAEEASSKQFNDNLLEALDLEEVNGQLRFKIPLYFSPNSQAIESLLFSLISNSIIKQKQAGKSFVQGSEFGFYDVVTKIPEKYKNDITWIRQHNNSLEPLSVKDGVLEPEGILLPNIYSNMLKAGQEVPQELLKVFGFRIPNQGHNSMSPLKIQGFLPKAAGDLVIITPEMLKRMGSDFDVDKLYIYFYNVKQTKEGLKKIEYLDNPKDVDKRWENYQEDVLKSKEAKKLFGLDDKDLRKNISKLKASIESFKSNISPEAPNETLAKGLELLNVSSPEALEEEVISILEEENKAYIYEEFKALPIELQNSKKARQNAILDIYFEIFSHPEILEKVMYPNDIQPLKDAVRRVMGEEAFKKDILTVKTQDDYYEANSGGKSGVGITSLWSTFFAQMQYYTVGIKGQGIMFKDSKGNILGTPILKIGDKELKIFWKKFNKTQNAKIIETSKEERDGEIWEVIRVKTSNNKEYELQYIDGDLEFINQIKDDFVDVDSVNINDVEITLNTKNNGLTEFNKTKGLLFNKWLSNRLQLFQSAAVDNAKEQILKPSGLSNETFDVAQMLVYAGIDDLDLIVAFLRQPYIEKYIDFIQRAKGRFAKFEKGSAQDRAVKSALDSINTQLKELKQPTYTTFNDTSVAYSKDEMIEFINLNKKETLTNEEKVKFLQGQYQLLSNFIQYKNKAERLGKAITAYNIDTKSVGKNYYEVTDKVNKFETYFVPKEKESTIPFYGLEEMGNNPFIKSLYQRGLRLAETAFNEPSILPFNSKFFGKLYQRAKEVLNKTDEDNLSAQDIKLLNKTAVWYITSMHNNGIFDDAISELRKELLTSVKEGDKVIKESLANKIQQLKEEGYNNWLIQRLTVKDDKIEYFRNNLEKSEEILAVISFNQLLEDYPEIGKQLVQYSYLTSGGSPTATGFNTIIPVTYLISEGFGEFYNSKSFQELLNDDKFINTFYDQYYRNNPTKAFNADSLNVKKLGDNNIQLDSPDALSEYVYKYIRPDKNKGEKFKAYPILFKRNPNYPPTQNVYYSLGILENEYEAGNDNLRSINEDNNKFITQPIKNKFEQKESLGDKLDVTDIEGTYKQYTQILKNKQPYDSSIEINVTEQEFNNLTKEEKEALIWQAKNC